MTIVRKSKLGDKIRSRIQSHGQIGSYVRAEQRRRAGRSSKQRALITEKCCTAQLYRRPTLFFSLTLSSSVSLGVLFSASLACLLTKSLALNARELLPRGTGQATLLFNCSKRVGLFSLSLSLSLRCILFGDCSRLCDWNFFFFRILKDRDFHFSSQNYNRDLKHSHNFRSQLSHNFKS